MNNPWITGITVDDEAGMRFWYTRKVMVPGVMK